MQSAPVSTPSTTSEWQHLIDRMPRPDKEDKILKNVEEGQVEAIVAELHAGGREAVVALVDLLVEPRGERTDSPVRHAVHALVMHAGALGDDHRAATAAALASSLNGRERAADVKAYVVRQLQLCGGREVAPALGKLLNDEQVADDAVMALIAMGAAEQLRAALPDLAGPQRVAVIIALGTLKDAASAEALRRTASRDTDPVARFEAARALASIGDPAAVDVVLKCADEASGVDRIRATSACLLLAENLAAAGKKDHATKIYRHLRDTRTDASDAHVRQLAERALQK